MPLPKPSLENRTFDQLLAEARGRLPQLAPAWTDYNYSDPGITLLDLMAARTESALYRLDRTPPALADNFLRLVGVTPATAQAAGTVLAVAAQNAPFVLPAGIQFADAAGAAIFQSSEDLNVSKATLMQVLAAGVDVTSPNGGGGVVWLPFGADPKAGDALYLGFDQALHVPGTPLRLYAWTGDTAGDRDVQAKLVAEYDAMTADAALCAAGCAPPVPDWRAHYSVRTQWEFHRGGGIWDSLDKVVDETRAFTLTGKIEFAAPAGHLPGGPDPALFFIRCRVVRGSYECVPRVERIALNAVAARHAVDVPAPETLGTSRGHAFQVFALQCKPVVPASTVLSLTLPSGIDNDWREVATWDVSGAHDKHYRLDAAKGVIECGNGSVGQVFPATAVLTITYQVGGGDAGNVAAFTLAQVPSSPLNGARYSAANGGLAPDWALLTLTQPYAALGGADAEARNTAEARANDVAFAATRAVTLDDFERLASAVPGVPVGRTHALSDYFPSLPCYPAAGSVTVAVVPACPDYRPTPSADFLDAVYRYLDRRRMVTTEVHVIAACYTTVSVNATLCLDGKVDAAGVRSAAQDALQRFFHPLHGGPDGDGWPIGRSVYRSEIMALLSGVSGVATVIDVGLSGDDDPSPRCENYPVCPDCLVRSGSHALCLVGPSPLTIIERSKPHECP
jgi:predicted phage baseplate assembly protein